MTNVNGIERVAGVIETMLNAEMAETTSTPDIFINTTEEVIKVAAGDIVDTNKLSVTEYFSNTFGGFTISVLTNKCGQWQEPNHMYFQVANALFLIAFLSPHKSYGFLLARSALVCGSILMTLWSYLIECSLDGIVWSGVFVVVNLAYLFVLVYQMRPVYFEKEIDAVNNYLQLTLLLLFLSFYLASFRVSACRTELHVNSKLLNRFFSSFSFVFFFTFVNNST